MMMMPRRKLEDCGVSLEEFVCFYFYTYTMYMKGECLRLYMAASIKPSFRPIAIIYIQNIRKYIYIGRKWEKAVWRSHTTLLRILESERVWYRVKVYYIERECERGEKRDDDKVRICSCLSTPCALCAPD